MSNRVKVEDITVVVKFCFQLIFTKAKNLGNRERKKNKTKRANVKQNVKSI